jgi:hypothetical protein
METTDVERRLAALMERHMPAPPATGILGSRLLAAVAEATLAGVPPEMIAFCIAQHAAATVAAQKIARDIRPQLADALAEDFHETVAKRSLQGIPFFIKPGARRG